jgi:flagellar biosynthetic protein FliO
MCDRYFRRLDAMRFPNIKSGVIFAAMVVLCCAALVRAGQMPTDANEKSAISNTGSLADHPFNSSKTIDGNLSSALHRMMVAVLIVILLGVAAMYASKKVLPKFSHSQGKRIKVVETIHLGTRKTVHLLEIGDQQILIGSTHDRITKLADIFSEKGFPLGQTDKQGAE